MEDAEGSPVEDKPTIQVGAYTRLESGLIVTDDRGRGELLAARRVLRFLCVETLAELDKDGRYQEGQVQDRRREVYLQAAMAAEMIDCMISRERERRDIDWDNRPALYADAIRSAIVREGFRVDEFNLGPTRLDGWLDVHGVFRLFGKLERSIRVRIADGMIIVACSLGVGEPQPFDGGDL